ncbi:MAG: PadR family transcriptional regulator [Saprospiraceae bacterium]|nr:PadR family transcriptional regulator [Saprospiraceae bacterium]
MQRSNIGEFEELVLLIVAIADGEAYGVSVMNDINAQTGRYANISAVHSALRRLETKGYVTSEWGAFSAERGGRRKRHFTITRSGAQALTYVKETRNRLWEQIPKVALKFPE